MNVYPAAADAFLAGSINILTDDVRAQLVGAGYSYDPGHEFLSSVPDGERISSPVVVAVDHVAGGVVFVGPVTFAAVAAGHVVTGVVFYVDGVDDSARRLVSFHDRRADTVPLSAATNGGDITLTFDRLLKI